MENLLFPFIETDTKTYAQMMQMGQVSDWGVKLLNPESMWALTRGKGVKVCVVDTGCDLKHPDLQSNIIDSFNAYGGDVDDKVSGHGTHVAGIIAAIDNNIGTIGVAPEASLLIAKGLTDNGQGDWTKISQAIQWGVKQGANIVNLSLGSNNVPPQILHDVIKWAVSKGTTLVAASGNDITVKLGGRSYMKTAYPARYPEVIAVAAIDKDYKLAHFSQADESVSVVAPGIDIYSTWKNGGYAKLTGTSQAAPMVSGACALLKAYYKEQIINYKDMLYHIRAIAEKSCKLGHISENIGIGVPNFANITVDILHQTIDIDPQIFSIFEDTDPNNKKDWEDIEKLYSEKEEDNEEQYESYDYWGD